MSKRAEQRALEAYPELLSGSIFGPLPVDLNKACREKYQEGYEQAEKDLSWHSVDESLPPMDEEVIALSDTATSGKKLPWADRICFAHIVDTNIAVDYNGWNIPGVRYWMPCPKIPEEDKK